MQTNVITCDRQHQTASHNAFILEKADAVCVCAWVCVCVCVCARVCVWSLVNKEMICKILFSVAPSYRYCYCCTSEKKSFQLSEITAFWGGCHLVCKTITSISQQPDASIFRVEE
jgi:hypothetical protein